jgi:RNA polymerase sigma factor (sigma-70 family)
MCRIAINEAFKLFRRKAVEQRHLRVIASERDGSTEVEPEDSRYQEIQESLAQLSDLDRTILVLKYHEGLSYDEIAAAMECAPGTVASRLNRARARLREKLGDFGESMEEPVGLRHQKGRGQGRNTAGPSGAQP